MPSYPERLAALEANQANILKTQDAIFDYMKNGKQQREQMIGQLSVVVENQIDMKAYQDRCDNERNDHDKRITKVEGFQARQIKAAIGAGGVAGFLVIGGAKVIDKILSVFS
jgi:hypothetical protein